MNNKTYIYTINHRSKIICLPPPKLAGDIGSPPSWSLQARSYRFKNTFPEYTSQILTEASWETHVQKHEVLSINSNEMENNK